MERRRSNPRVNWQQTVESQGLSFHSTDRGVYWDESACYVFSRRQIETLERATYTINDLCLQAVEHLLTERPHLLTERFLIPEPFVNLCRRSWDRDEITIYGRFDLAYDGHSAPKMLEYNADTPTALVEAAVIQWYWMKDVQPRADQFNSLHDRLIEAWQRWKAESPVGQEPVTFVGVNTSDEDAMTVLYLRDTATQAKLTTQQFDVMQLGWNGREFVDPNKAAIRTCFKLYPWEWMIREPFAVNLGTAFDRTHWLEPMWKMILSNKAILPVLWELFPGHVNLLPASFERLGWDCVRKPIFGREGRGVMIIPGSKPEPPYVAPDKYAGPPVYQSVASIPTFEGNHPVIGSWMVNGYACGIGIREDRTKITGNLSRFIPHVMM